ncbi:MAG: hypothetical protein II735_07780, partial [Clostridia bacterium]|nr:hypothetical protein [Clostridia bacterium]
PAQAPPCGRCYRWQQDPRRIEKSIMTNRSPQAVSPKRGMVCGLILATETKIYCSIESRPDFHTQHSLCEKYSMKHRK